MSNANLLVLFIGVLALITPSLARFPHHHDHISPMFSPGPAPEQEPPTHHHKPHHEHKHHGKEHMPLGPAEPPQEGFFPPTHKPSPHHGHFPAPAYPPMKSGGEGHHMPPGKKPHHIAPSPY